MRGSCWNLVTIMYTSQDIRYCICTSAIFDFPSQCCIKEYSLSSNVLLDLKNGVMCLKFSYIALESCNLIYIQSDGRHFVFVGVTSNIVKTEKLINKIIK